jgi:hypothetical protein
MASRGTPEPVVRIEEAALVGDADGFPEDDGIPEEPGGVVLLAMPDELVKRGVSPAGIDIIPVSVEAALDGKPGMSTEEDVVKMGKMLMMPSSPKALLGMSSIYTNSSFCTYLTEEAQLAHLESKSQLKGPTFES